MYHYKIKAYHPDAYNRKTEIRIILKDTLKAKDKIKELKQQGMKVKVDCFIGKRKVKCYL